MRREELLYSYKCALFSQIEEICQLQFLFKEMEEESGPSTRFRRRSSKNYVENESEVTDEEDEE